MNFSIVKRIIGYVLVFVAVLMVLPCIVAVIYQEREGWSFVITAALCLLLGFLFMWKKPESRVFYVKEGFVAVALSWIIMSVMGSLPFLITGTILRRSPGLRRPDPASCRMWRLCLNLSCSGGALHTGSAVWVFLYSCCPCSI